MRGERDSEVGIADNGQSRVKNNLYIVLACNKTRESQPREGSNIVL